MEGKKQIDVFFEAVEETGEGQIERAEIKIRLIERDLLNDQECEDLNCMTVDLLDQGSIYWEESMAQMDLMIQFKVYKDDQWMGSISVPLKELFVFDGSDFKQWFTLFDSPTDDIFDGDVGIDDQECPRILLNFQFQDLEEQTAEISHDPSIATSTFGEEELVVRSVQDAEFGRKEESSFGDLGLARESVNLEGSHAYASEHKIKLDFQSNQTDSPGAPLWKLPVSFLKTENAQKSPLKRKISQSKDFGSSSKQSRDSMSKRSRNSPRLESQKKSVGSERQFSPLKSELDVEEPKLEYMAQAAPFRKSTDSTVNRLEQQLANALLEVERLKLIAKEKDSNFKAAEDNLKQELRFAKEENDHLQSEVRHARDQNSLLKKSNQSEREELLDKIGELSSENKTLHKQIDKLERQLNNMEILMSEMQTTTTKSNNTSILGVNQTKTNSELVFTPLSKAKEVDSEEELTQKVKAYFAKKLPHVEVKPAGKGTDQLNQGLFQVGDKKILFKISNKVLMAKAGANYLPINQYMTLYRIDSTQDSRSKNKENSPRVRPKTPTPAKAMPYTRSKSPNRFKF